MGGDGVSSTRQRCMAYDTVLWARCKKCRKALSLSGLPWGSAHEGMKCISSRLAIVLSSLVLPICPCPLTTCPRRLREHKTKKTNT